MDAKIQNLRDALNDCLLAMVTREKRDSGELKIPEPAFRPIWECAKAMAHEALAATEECAKP